MTPEIGKIIDKMSLADKAKLLSGRDIWSTHPLENHNIPAMYVADGPHGLRKMDSDVAELHGSVPATCFPTASALSATWNIDLIQEVGAAIGKECQANNVQILLGPGLNIKRTPLNGRNFEYYSEDPHLSGKMAAAFVNGVQSEGVGACLKHFVANNQEHERMMNSSNVDERTLREIYLKGFEIAIKESNPWSLMCAYNKLNGVWAAENQWLLTEVLRGEFGFNGFVVSDWGAVNHPNRAVQAGLNLEMPDNAFSPDIIVNAVKSGDLEEERLDTVLTDLLKIILKTNELKKTKIQVDLNEHHKLAVRTAEESMVLLKNENDLLPLNHKHIKSVAILGRFAKQARIQGGGSSNVNPFIKENALACIQAMLGEDTEVHYLPVYEPLGDKYDTSDLAQAVAMAKKADVALVFIGLPDDFEVEGLDREHMDIPESHKALIREVAQVQPNTVAILSNGAAIEIEEWERDVPAILESWLAGQGSGLAVTNILFGKANPSGKLGESFPLRLQHNPAHLNFPGFNREVTYHEGIFVGYRYYDTKSIEVMYPFGHGLSYTTFEYSNILVDKKELTDKDTLKVRFRVKNTGKLAGAEVAQLYVRDVVSTFPRPVKELKAFKKVYLEAGEEQLVEFELTKTDFSYYDDRQSCWFAESGEFQLLIGSSSRDIRLHEMILLESSQQRIPHFDRYSPMRDLLNHPAGQAFVKNILKSFGTSMESDKPEDIQARAIFLSLPAVKAVNFSHGAFSLDMLDSFLATLNE